MDIPCWERPCGPLSLRLGGLLVVTFDLSFVLTSLLIHFYGFSSKLLHPYSIAFFIITGMQAVLVLVLLLGVLKRKLIKCQVYMLSTILILLAETVTFSFYVFQMDHKLLVSKLIYFPLYFVYKLYTLWVVRCLIIGLIREKRLAHVTSTRKFSLKPKDSIKMDRRSVVSSYTKASTLGKSPAQARRFLPAASISGESYEVLRGIDDILLEIEFPQDEYIPLDKFRIDSETLKIEDDFFVKKGQLQVGPGKFQNIAVKVFKPKTSAEAVRLMLLETKIMTLFRKQSNIIQLLGFCTDNIHKGKMILLLEFCEKGTLEDFLKENYAIFQDLIRGDEIISTLPPQSSEEENLYENLVVPTNSDFPFNTRTLILWAFQIANGMQYINDKGIIHGNLGSKHIIVDNHRLKIGNFTFATLLHHCRKSGGTINLHHIEGQLPWRYMPCEFMDELTEKNFTSMSDVWSYGVVLWEIFSLGCTPYDGMTVSEFFPKLREGYRLEKPPFATNNIYQILRNCWDTKPQQRPTFAQLKANFTDVIQNLG